VAVIIRQSLKYVCPKLTFMLGPNDMSIKAHDILTRIDDAQMFAELEKALQVLEERERKINKTLAELLCQVDELLIRFDSIDDAQTEDESLNSF
jgi:plasmid replication initiation protein